MSDITATLFPLFEGTARGAVKISKVEVTRSLTGHIIRDELADCKNFFSKIEGIPQDAAAFWNSNPFSGESGKNSKIFPGAPKILTSGGFAHRISLRFRLF